MCDLEGLTTGQSLTTILTLFGHNLHTRYCGQNLDKVNT